MTQSKFVLTALVAALALDFLAPTLTPNRKEVPLSNSDILIVQAQTGAVGQTEEDADESAKMGKEEGTQTGADAAARDTDTDTKKIDQPEKGDTTSAPDGGESGSSQ